MKLLLLSIAASAVLIACAGSDYYNPLDDYEEVEAATNLDMPTPTDVPLDKAQAIARGEYLTELLGCGACHTDGALIGMPDSSRPLAGSSIGIAYTNPLESKNPGVVFASNLTPDRETGLGLWSDEQIAAAVRSGAGRHGQRLVLVMPWQRYAKISNEDVAAIVGYLRNLEPIEHQVPNAVSAGTKTRHPFVHFGVYRSRDM